MLEEIYHCDGPGCKNTTPKNSPGWAWRVLLWLTAHVDGDSINPIQDTREWHFCSQECMYDATEPQKEL